MIKLVIFDLDGVLIKTKMIHFNALNKALEKYENYKIPLKEHLEIFDGLPTNEKLKILLDNKKISKKNILLIKKSKQIFTRKEIWKIKLNKNIVNIFKKLKKNQNIKIAIATNAVQDTLNIVLEKLKIKKYIDFSICNNDVINPKPHPEIYISCLYKFKIKPKECLILEDSYYGRTAAYESGCHLMPIKKTTDVNYSNIVNFMKKIKKNKINNKNNYKWDDPNLNILIPMAGHGSRFKDAGYTFPKPLIEIKLKPMIQLVIESLNLNGNFIFIIQKEHQKKYNIKSTLTRLVGDCKVVEVDKVTKGAACTTLLAKKFIDNNHPLIISNSDQFVEWDSSKTMYNFTEKKFDGGILTFNSVHPKWSYAECYDKSNIVKRVAEKNVISNNATVGVYYWAKGKDYVKYAEQMIKKKILVNNEYYVCPVFNEAILDGKKVAISKVNKMRGLGTPEDLKEFLHEIN